MVPGRKEMNETLVCAGIGHVNAQTVKVLLDHNAQINATDHRHETPLHCAIDSWESDSPEIVKVLLEAGADIHLEDRAGRTPLSKARNARNQEIRDLLEKHAEAASAKP